MVTAYVGLGSNIDPEKNLRRAAALLRTEWPALRFSSIYRSAAREYEEQEDFLNVVATFETTLQPEAVFQALQRMEKKLGKNTLFRFGPRTIDLDLLLYEELVLPNPEGWLRNQKLETGNLELLVPHARMHERRFVLEPLCELLDPDSRHPVLQKTWGELLLATQNQRCKRRPALEEFAESLRDASPEPVEGSA